MNLNNHYQLDLRVISIMLCLAEEKSLYKIWEYITTEVHESDKGIRNRVTTEMNNLKKVILREIFCRNGA